ncbi:hypothetical protein [Microbulbifer sp. JTAC008]|uniref:hypothetical protein n=1 Tax=unclassified Microbulbifer TaxID=2619833 RepID=UPI004039D469
MLTVFKNKVFGSFLRLKYFSLINLVFLLHAAPSFSYSLDQSYQLYADGSTYYLKTDSIWVPIGVEIMVIIPAYKDGQVLKLEKVNGNWVVESISISIFNAVAPSLLSGNRIQYVDTNTDGHLDIQVSLGGADGTVILLNDGTSSVFTASKPERRVIFIHTDLLGSPAAETDVNGQVLSR